MHINTVYLNALAYHNRRVKNLGMSKGHAMDKFATQLLPRERLHISAEYHMKQVLITHLKKQRPAFAYGEVWPEWRVEFINSGELVTSVDLLDDERLMEVLSSDFFMGVS